MTEFSCCLAALGGISLHLHAVLASNVSWLMVLSMLLPPAGTEVRQKGGFNGLWGATLKEVNDRMAQYGGRLSLDELDAEAGKSMLWQRQFATLMWQWVRSLLCSHSSWVLCICAARPISSRLDSKKEALA